MPTYSYRCPKCEKIFDAFHSMMCKDPQHCPDCGAEGNKLMSASSVIFKGSGFYSTDYRDSGYLEAKKKDGNSPVKPADSKPDASATPSSDSNTPAKKSETPAATTAPSTSTPTKAPPTAQAA
ncbi:MAG: FmdB family transcriptional regulator [Candidatus Riflebacteria bacterium HGW-Riflebacteria-2]|jgi:putative FmdB family regulatory protein|nr:MAG: FmdB family transcriptional regulator [Candidatus Riflebacteria bacterium HGW-Riflebacteria-2]